MKRWRTRANVVVIGAASLVMLVTVLPQVASGLGLSGLADRLAGSGTCSSGSSGSMGGSGGSSGMCCPASSESGSGVQCTGIVTGTVTITGAPKSFTPGYVGVGACPVTGSSGGCANPTSYLTGNGGTYSLTLAAGGWKITPFYEINPYGGAFLGKSAVVTVPAGGTVTQNFTVPFKNAAAVVGTVTVHNAPPTDPIYALEVLLCPSFGAPYTGGAPPVQCVTNYLPAPEGTTSGSFSVTGLPPGVWTAYPGFCSYTGCGFNPDRGKSVKLVGGQTSSVNVHTDFLLPGQALLTGTVSVTGAPSGVTDPVGVTMCLANTADCRTIYEGFSGSDYAVVESPGVWTVKPIYLSSPYDNAVDGPVSTVTLTEGVVTPLDLTVPYQAPGTASGTIVVEHLPSGVKVRQYTVLACPASAPWTGGSPAPECVSEFSGPSGFGFGLGGSAVGAADLRATAHTGVASKPPASTSGPARSPYNMYSLPTLTPGSWLLYAGYRTVFDSVIGHKPATVVVTAGETTTRTLTVRYRPQTNGAIVGTVDVIGAPNTYFQSGVQACTAAPTASTCPGELDAYGQFANGRFTLLLPAGTWWVRGFVDVYGFGTDSEYTSGARQVQVTAESTTKESFTVHVS